LQKYYLAAVLVSGVPYILTKDQLPLLSGWLWAFPVIGGILGIAAVWHYGAEYVRSKPLNTAFLKLLQEAVPTVYQERTRWNWLFLGPNIGWMTVGLLSVVTTALAAINLYLVTRR
jgi:hypothetical protein